MYNFSLKIYHLVIISIFIILSLFGVSYILYEQYLINSYRDVEYPPHYSFLIRKYSYLWDIQSSRANLEFPSRVWLSIIPLVTRSIFFTIRFDIIHLLILMMLIPYISFFYLLKNFLNLSPKGSLLISITLAFIYSLNSFTIQSYSPPYTYTYSYFILPATIGGVLYFLRSNNLKSKLLLSFLITLAITPIIRYVVFVSILIIITTIIYIIFFNRTFSFFKKIIKNYFTLSSLLIFINSYWLLATIISSSSKVIAPNYVINYDTISMFSSSYKPLDIFTLKASWWPYLKLRTFPPIPEIAFNMILFLIPILALASIFLFNKYKKEEKLLVITGSLILLLGIFLWRGLTNFNPIFSNFYEFLLFSTHTSIGWMFRVPEYFGSLVVLGYSLCIVSLFSFLFRSRVFNINLGIILCVILILSSFIIGWQRFTGDLDGILRKGYYFEDREHYDIAPYNKSIILLSNYQGNFKSHHTGKPYINLPNDLNKYLEYSLRKGDEKTILFTSYLAGADAFITNLNIENPKFYYLYPESKEGINIYLPNKEINNIYIQNKLASSKDFDHKLLGSLALFNDSLSVLTQERNDRISELEINPDIYSTLLSKNYILIKTFDTTFNHNPSKLWSKASTSDPLHGGWHPYLERFGIENWQSDYGKGLVFTWAPSKLKEKINPTEEDLINIWSFSSESDVEEWKNYTKENQFGAIHKILWDENERALKAELWNSTWGWKTINSPLIPVEYGNFYKVEFKIKLENGESVHLKLIEYDSKGKILNSKQILSIGSGTVGWKKFNVNFMIEDTETENIQLQIWHGHETKQSLPNIIWLKDFKIYDLKDFIEPNSLEIPFEIEKNDEYVLLVRYFKNQEGGKIKIEIDNKSYIINTKDQLNKFFWERLDALNLKSGKYKIVLSNLVGFNAVNLFVLVPSKEYDRILNEIENTMKEKRILYIFEGESDLYRDNVEIKKDKESSNGELVEILPNGYIWREFEIIKEGFYKFAFRLKGNFKVNIDNRTFNLYSEDLDFVYLDPIHLEKGKHKIEVIPKLVVENLSWSFDSEKDVEEWKNYTKENQFGAIHKILWDENERALKAELWNSTWGWKTINSPLIPAKYGEKYTISFEVMAENGESVHYKIVELDSKRKILQGYYAGGVGSGNFSWKRIEYYYEPKNISAAYIQLQIWHGHETKQQLPNIIWIRNSTFSTHKRLLLDNIFIYSVNDFASEEKIEDLFKSEEIFAEVLNYSKINPTLWKVQVNASRPFMLSFAESYDPLWEARVYKDGKLVEKAKSLPLYGVINGFWINTMGENLEIVIRYTPQDWFEIGLVISATTFALCIFYLIYDWRRSKGDRWAKRFERAWNERVGRRIERRKRVIDEKIFRRIEKIIIKFTMPLKSFLIRVFEVVKRYW